MPVAAVTSTLASGFVPLFEPDKSPGTTAGAAKLWAGAYVGYVNAGGIPSTYKQASLTASLTTAFNPYLAGGGLPLLIQALTLFWLGLAVPAQSGIVTLFAGPVPPFVAALPPEPTAQDQANGLAQVISTLTLGAVKITSTVPVPGTIVPLL